MHKSFKNKKEIMDLYEKRNKVLQPFINLYKKLVISHSTPNKKDFISILNQAKIILPTNKTDKKSSYMEKLLGMDKAIFYAIGFPYVLSYNWKYSLVFDIEYIKKCEYYKKSVGYQAYKNIFNYWYKKDDTIKKIASKNKRCEEVIDEYLNKELFGEKRKILRFWEIEKEIYEEILYHPKKDYLIFLAKKAKKELLLESAKAITDAPKIIEDFRVPEIISFKEKNLKKNKHFLGIALIKKDREIETLFKKLYPEKEIFFIDDL
ncbi:MAG: hypothetical protein ACMXX9_04095 [Candidatus Woesearchaeota archaeon]